MGEIMKVKSVNTAITVLIAVVIVFSMSAGVLWVSNNTYQTVMAEEKSAMDNSVKQIMAALKGYVDQSESMVRMLASQQIMRDALEGRDFAGADAEFRNLFATSKSIGPPLSLMSTARLLPGIMQRARTWPVPIAAAGSMLRLF